MPNQRPSATFRPLFRSEPTAGVVQRVGRRLCGRRRGRGAPTASGRGVVGVLGGGGQVGAAAQAPDEDVADGGGGVELAPSGGFDEQGGRGGPAWLGPNWFGQLWQHLMEKVGLSLPNTRGQTMASLAEDGHGVGCGGLVGGAEVFGGLLGSGGLLAVVSLGVPRRGDGEGEGRVDERGGGVAIVTAAEDGPAVDEISGGLSLGAVVPAYGLHVGAAGARTRRLTGGVRRVWAADVLASASRISPAAAMWAAAVPSSAVVDDQQGLPGGGGDPAPRERGTCHGQQVGLLRIRRRFSW